MHSIDSSLLCAALWWLERDCSCNLVAKKHAPSSNAQRSQWYVFLLFRRVHLGTIQVKLQVRSQQLFEPGHPFRTCGHPYFLRVWNVVRPVRKTHAAKCSGDDVTSLTQRKQEDILRQLHNKDSQKRIWFSYQLWTTRGATCMLGRTGSTSATASGRSF